MKTSVSITHMKEFDLLSEDEVKLRVLLARVKDTTLLGTVICQGLRDNTAEGFRSLVETLRSQGADGPGIMEGAIGREAMTLLMGNNKGKMSGSCRQFV